MGDSMKRKANLLLPLSCFGLFIFMILSAETVTSGAKAGIELCIYTVLPALFPFILIATVLTDITAGCSVTFLKPLRRFCGIPEGAENIFLLGILGGYPTGAQAVTKNYRDGKITQQEAEHLLRFCNNAGPAFIFGVIGNILNNFGICLLIWAIHIGSAIITGMLFARPVNSHMTIGKKNISFTDALDRTVKTMGKICGWVILFRIVIAFIDKYLYVVFPTDVTLILCGILELSNGCIRLNGLDTLSIFIITSFMLSFGGVCVWMQTASIIKPLRMRNFCIGKFVQSIISVLLCFLIAPIWFEIPITVSFICAALILGLIVIKKSSSFLKLSRV